MPSKISVSASFGLHAYFDFIAPAVLLIRNHELLFFEIQLLVSEDEA
jgi:hypothetical protein